VSDQVARIQNYFDGTLTYPLMVVVTSDEYSEIREAFSGTPVIKVSDYCVGADKEPDTEKLLANIKCTKGTNILLGLGDYLASKPDSAMKVLMSYKDLVLPNDARIVILLSAHMYPIAQKLLQSDLRARTRIVLPKTVPTVKPLDSNALVYGIKSYLEACERGESVGNVRTGLNISAVNVINPENAFDELKHKFPSEFNRLTKNAGTNERWGELLENLNKSKLNVVQYLAEQNFSPIEYTFFDYAKRNDYKAWLFFINLKLNTTSKDYLGYIASKCDMPSDLFVIAKTAILDIATTDNRFKNFYEQRKLLLKNCEDFDIADFIPKIAVKGDNRVAYLTDNTNLEKKTVIEALCEGANDISLEVTYPDLYRYMQSYIFDDKRFTDYFEAYKRCKLTNKIENDFLKLVDEYAVSRPYNSLPARPSLFMGLDDDNTVLIFLDALGVEYLGYIKEKCADLELRFLSKIARAELPTITSANKKFYTEWRGKKEVSIKALDNIKHHPEYGYDFSNSPLPIHLVEELEQVKEALERAKTKLSSGECKKVVIASDHGASRLAVISPDRKLPNNGCESKSNGRYCAGDSLPVAPNITTDTEGGYAAITDYSRFEGSRIASVETHGGATLEEVLVPIIELTLSDSSKEVTFENTVIEVSHNIVPTLNIFIIPDCDNVTASISGQFYEVEKLDKSKFKISMPELKKGTYTLNLFENQNPILPSKEFAVKSKGFAERDLF